MALSDNLISYWSLDEASGDAIDAHSTNDLAEFSGTIASTTGKVSTCRDFEAGDTENFFIASNAELQVGDIDFSAACWVNPESTPEFSTLVGKWNATNGERQWVLRFTTDAKIAFVKSSDGFGTTTQIQVDSTETLSNGTWYFVAGGHNASTDEIWISVNAGTPATLSTSTGVHTSDVTNFRFGSRNSSNYLDGLLDEVGFWKRDIRSDLTELYNSGNGRDYDYIINGAAVADVFFENRHSIGAGIKPLTAAGMNGVLIT